MSAKAKGKTKTASRKKKPRRVVLFPSEEPPLGSERIRQAVLKVIAERRAAEKAARARKQ